MSVWVTVAFLSVSFKQCGHSPLTSLKVSPSAELLLTGSFLFFAPFRVKTLETVVPENPRRSVVSEQRFSNQPVWHQLSCHGQSQHRIFSPCWCLTWVLSEGSWSLSAQFYALHCCHMTGWLDNCLNKQEHRCLMKCSECTDTRGKKKKKRHSTIHSVCADCYTC